MAGRAGASPCGAVAAGGLGRRCGRRHAGWRWLDEPQARSRRSAQSPNTARRSRSRTSTPVGRATRGSRTADAIDAHSRPDSSARRRDRASPTMRAQHRGSTSPARPCRSACTARSASAERRRSRRRSSRRRRRAIAAPRAAAMPRAAAAAPRPRRRRRAATRRVRRSRRAMRILASTSAAALDDRGAARALGRDQARPTARLLDGPGAAGDAQRQRQDRTGRIAAGGRAAADADAAAQLVRGARGVPAVLPAGRIRRPALALDDCADRRRCGDCSCILMHRVEPVTRQPSEP